MQKTGNRLSDQFSNLKVGLEVSKRSETMRNRKYAKFRIFPMVKKNFLAHLTKKFGDFGKNKLDFFEKNKFFVSKIT